MAATEKTENRFIIRGREGGGRSLCGRAPQNQGEEGEENTPWVLSRGSPKGANSLRGNPERAWETGLTYRMLGRIGWHGRWIIRALYCTTATEPFYLYRTAWWAFPNSPYKLNLMQPFFIHRWAVSSNLVPNLELGLGIVSKFWEAFFQFQTCRK